MGKRASATNPFITVSAGGLSKLFGGGEAAAASEAASQSPGPLVKEERAEVDVQSGQVIPYSKLPAGAPELAQNS